ncbi:MAG: response regulator transcription factor [Gammaproteobacteria bacterium]|nr:response regulator transcription factor [Gammaproteobacteria bacterium]
MTGIPTTGLVVDDLPEARSWLCDALRHAFPGIDIREAASLESARGELARLPPWHPEIALVDLGLPDGSGTDLITELRSQDASVVTVVTTIFDDDSHLFGALKVGADGYVLKDQSRGQLVDMLAGIHAGQPPLSPSIARKLLQVFQEPRQHSPDPEAQLTSREQEVLTLIAKGYTVGRVAELLGITRNTAAGYVKSIYRKLNVSSRAEATLAATRQGLIGLDSV